MIWIFRPRLRKRGRDIRLRLWSGRLRKVFAKLKLSLLILAALGIKLGVHFLFYSSINFMICSSCLLIHWTLLCTHGFSQYMEMCTHTSPCNVKIQIDGSNKYSVLWTWELLSVHKRIERTMFDPHFRMGGENGLYWLEIWVIKSRN